MAKVSFTKLQKEIEKQAITIDFNDEVIEVQQFLPSASKLAFIANVALNSINTDPNYANQLKIKIYFMMELIVWYTNIEFSQEELENVTLIYDNMVSSGLMEKIISNIPENEKKELWDGITLTIENIYKYQNSALGILSAIQDKYDFTSLDLAKLQEQIKNPENLQLLKEVSSHLG